MKNLDEFTGFWIKVLWLEILFESTTYLYFKHIAKLIHLSYIKVNIDFTFPSAYSIKQKGNWSDFSQCFCSLFPVGGYKNRKYFLVIQLD